MDGDAQAAELDAARVAERDRRDAAVAAIRTRDQPQQQGDVGNRPGERPDLRPPIPRGAGRRG